MGRGIHRASDGGHSRWLIALLLVGMFIALAIPAGAVTATTDLNGQTATDLANSLVGPGVTVSNVTFVGDKSQAGTFVADPGTIGFDAGVVLSSGDIADTVGPNTVDDKTTAFGTAGDADLDTLSGFDTYDAAVLEFDFTANADTVYFRYVFASEEYNEYVNSPFNDTFAFFVNGVNCATVPDGSGGFVPVTVNTINNGNPYSDASTATNPGLFRNNDLDDGGGSIFTEMDGLSVVLTCMASVNVGANHMKLAIADASDQALDSAVFLEQGSLSTTPPSDIAKVTGGGRVDLSDGVFTFGTTVIADEQGLRGNLQVNDHRTGDRFHGYSVDALSVSDSTATWSGQGRWNGQDGYTFEVTVVDNRNGNSAKKGDPDTISVTIWDSDSQVVFSTEGASDLLRGNIKVH